MGHPLKTLPTYRNHILVRRTLERTEYTDEPERGEQMGMEKLLPRKSGPAPLRGVTALVGAGASVDAGIPMAWPLFDEIVGSLVKTDWAVKELGRLARLPRKDARDEHDVIRLETLLLWVGRIYDPSLAVFGFLDEFTEPAELHRRFAGAARLGLRLTTVNFDDLLERALIEQGDLPVTIDAHGLPLSRPLGIPVIKFHGTRARHLKGKVTRPARSLHATTQVIAATNPGAFLNTRAATALSCAVDDRVLIVAGYSASDDLDIVPALRLTKPRRVIWIDHDDSEPEVVRLKPRARDAPLWHSLLDRMRQSGTDIRVLRGRTAEVMEALALTAPSIVKSPLPRRVPNWRVAVKRWARSVRSHDPTGLGLAALLFGDMGRYELNERALVESRPSPLPDGRWTAARCDYEQAQTAMLKRPGDPAAAYALGLRAKRQASGRVNERVAVLADLLLGRAAFLQQEYDTARGHFLEARDAVLPGSIEWAHALAWLGRTEVWGRHPRRGMRDLKRAAAVFRRGGELEALLDAAEAIGIGRLALIEISRARPALTEARKLAGSLGYVDRRFTTECGLAEAEVLGGAIATARSMIDGALALVADRGHDEVADAWALLVEVELEQGRFRAAAKAAGKALATTTVVNRTRCCLHLTNLAEARYLSGYMAAASRALEEAERCPGECTEQLGEAKCDLLRSALNGEAVRRSLRQGLLPAESVRLERAIARVGGSR
jgi:tetratricopeptide (TPR) repeat protein